MFDASYRFLFYHVYTPAVESWGHIILPLSVSPSVRPSVRCTMGIELFRITPLTVSKLNILPTVTGDVMK